MEKRRFSAGDFDGPLDLLWTLIRENRMSVFDIQISEITKQYLSFLDNAIDVDLNDLSDFYRMASRLIRIKSAELLPENESDNFEDYEDLRLDLVDSLIEYQRFKILSSLMEKSEDDSLWRFERKKIRRLLPETSESKENWQKIDTDSLLSQMQKMYSKMMKSISDARILDLSEETSVSEKLSLMEEFFERKGECLFSELVRSWNPIDIVCAFLAVLEAVKFRAAVIFQNKVFGEIKICRRVQ